MSVPIRKVLLIGDHVSEAANLVGTLTSRKRSIAFPCKHRVKIEAGDEVVQADLLLYQSDDPLGFGTVEPKKPDVVILCTHAFNPETANLLALERWKEKIGSMECPKILVSTGLEQCVPHFMAEEEKDSANENPSITSAGSLSLLCEEVSACACFEVSTQHAARVQQLFAHALLAAISPTACTIPTTPESVLTQRRALMQALVERKIGVIPKPTKLAKTQDDKQAKEVFTKLGIEQPWERKVRKEKISYHNVYTHEKLGPARGQKAPGNYELEDRVKLQRRKFEHEVDQMRAAQISDVEDERLARMENLEAQYGQDFAATASDLLREIEVLKKDTTELRAQYDSIREEQAKNDTRGDELQTLSDLRATKDAVIQQRVEEDIDHERKMEAFQEELNTLQNTDLKKNIKHDTFDAVTIENRRLQQQLRSVLEESKSLRTSIKKVEERTKQTRSQIDSGQQICMKTSSKANTARNKAAALKEDIAKLRAEKDWHSNALFLRRSTETAVAQQLRDWKREGRVLRSMIADIDDKIKEQEQPIALYLTEEKRRARARGGPLLLDDEDIVNWKNRRSHAGEYQAPSNKQLMQRLHTEHDRLHLQYNFLSADVAEKAALSDETLHTIKSTLKDYFQSESQAATSAEEVTQNLHKLLLLLGDLLTSRRLAVKHMQHQEDSLCEHLVSLQTQSDSLLRSTTLAGFDGDFAQVRESQEAMRSQMYEGAEAAEQTSLLRREQVTALQAVCTQKRKVTDRLRHREAQSEAQEAAAAELYRDVVSVIETAESTLERHLVNTKGKVTRSFLNKAIQGLHHDTQALIVRRCSRRPLGNIEAPPKEGKKKGKGTVVVAHESAITRASLGLAERSTVKKVRAGTKRRDGRPTYGPPGQYSAEVEHTKERYADLASALSEQFGVGQRGSASDGFQKGWKKLW